MNYKKILWIILLIILIVSALAAIIVMSSRNNTNIDSTKIQVVVSNFASYDFIRAIIADTNDVELTFLIGPGKDAHSYDPTSQDLITIQNSDLFIYIGGEMENWSEKVLEAINVENTKIICIADDIETIEEQEVDGAEEDDDTEEDGAFDEHIWTSPANAIEMVNILEIAMSEINPNNAEIYKKNAENYISQIEEIDAEIQEIVDNKVRNRLIFGDKMPMQYFINYYGLEVSAAFNGCSTDTEPSSKTITYLVDKVREENIPVVLYVELGTGTVAQTIAEEAGNGCVAMQIQTLHNVSKEDFDNGETWVSLMRRNLSVLKAALQ